MAELVAHQRLADPGERVEDGERIPLAEPSHEIPHPPRHDGRGRRARPRDQGADVWRGRGEHAGERRRRDPGARELAARLGLEPVGGRRRRAARVDGEVELEVVDARHARALQGLAGHGHEGERRDLLHRGQPIDGGAERGTEGGRAPVLPGTRRRHGAPLDGRHRVGVEVGDHRQARLLVDVERLRAGHGQVIALGPEDCLGLCAPPRVGREPHQDFHQRLVGRPEGRAPPGARAVTLLEGGRVPGAELRQLERALAVEVA